MRKLVVTFSLGIALWAPTSLTTAVATVRTFPDVQHKVQVLYTFSGGSGDGETPQAGLVADAHGDLFGTTSFGGVSDDGTAFVLAPQSGGFSESLIASFSSSTGTHPVSGLMIDSKGNLFGTTPSGGGSQGGGTVYELTPSSSGYGLQILANFVPLSATGDTPLAGLTSDGNGDLFGTTSEGGFCLGGTVFELSPAFSVLHDFGCDDNVKQPASSVTLAPDGSIFGTTEYGGNGPCDQGCGIVYKLTPGPSGYTKKTVHAFQGGSDGANPVAPLVVGPNGTLYGTTSAGGGSSACTGGCGTVYALTPVKTKYKETVLYGFQGATDGASPVAGVTLYGSKIYGTTKGGGLYRVGTIFELKPLYGGFAESVVFSFAGGYGANPESNLLLVNGLMYGTAAHGGQGGRDEGTVFAFRP
jgi:uncharacterized repeat protein (TIGR03803 family)